VRFAERLPRPDLSGIDRGLLLNAGALATLGLVVSLAASPAAAARMGIDNAFYFALRHSGFLFAGAAAAVAAAHLSPVGVRRAGAVLFAVMLPLVALTLALPERNGAARWFSLGPVSFQPSEFLKPALVIVWAWMLSEGLKHPGFPGRAIAAGLFAVSAGLLLAQPDLGQTALLGMTLGAMLFMAGLDWRWMAAGVAAAAAAAFGAYHFYPHARERVDAFFSPDGPGGYQVERSLDAISAGGLFGQGPGEGQVKLLLPDAQGDFIAAVAAEEFGLIAMLALIGLFGAMVLRGLSRASRIVDPFAQLATAGLICLLGLQACIHLAVNLVIVPAKGMTLPFVSYGGTSMLAAALTLGFILALTRRRPYVYLYDRPEAVNV
jgi:cell division protein FtsW